MPILQAVKLRKSFGANPVLNDVSLSIERGEAVCLLGPSGAGKSTLIRCFNMLEIIDSGHILLDGELLGHEVHKNAMRPLRDKELSVQRRRLGMVFQQFNLFPHMSVLDNITVSPVKVLGRPRADVEREARDLLERVGLPDKALAYPAQLSGGQQQRIAIARALAMKPEIMLLDEPTSALDPELVSEVLQTIRDLVGSGITMAIVTHEIGFAREVCDRFVFMEAGAIVESGPVGNLSVANAGHERTRDFLSKVL